jgi:4-amino-4-deoxy-L-arabinose transferase-like glycosyltransferase
MTEPESVSRGEAGSPIWRAAAVVGLAVAAAAAAVAIQRNLFPYFSGDHDEPVYQFQAMLLLHGHLTLSAAQQDPFFRPWLSGTHDGHLVLAFTWAWPLVLAAARWLTGSMLPAIAASFSFAVITCYLFAREVLDRHWKALLAAALVALSPFTLVLAGTYLNYVFALGLYLLFGWLLLRGLRTGSSLTLLLAGASWGAILLTRPYDAVLVAVPTALFLFLRRSDHGLLGPLLRLALGAAPLVGLALGLNWVTGGSPFAFPTSVQSQGTARFFWGYRSLAPDVPGISFTVGNAFSSLGRNLWAVPTWMFGTYLAIALAVYGGVRLARRAPRRLALLVGLLLVFPLGYVAWFASALTAPGALNGMGPHYYLPMTVPIAILAAEGVAGALERPVNWLLPGLGLAVVAVVLTAVALPPKLDDKRYVRDVERTYANDVAKDLGPLPKVPSIVVLERGLPPYVMAQHVTLRNPPDLDSRVLYAVDRGAQVSALLRAEPDRRAYRLTRLIPAGGDIFAPNVVAEPLAVTTSSQLTLTSRITNTHPNMPAVAAYLADANIVVAQVTLDLHSAPGRSYQVIWRVTPDGGAQWSTDGRSFTSVATRVRPSGLLAVGTTYAADASGLGYLRSEHRYEYRLAPTAVQVVTADEQWEYPGPPFMGWLPFDVSKQIAVSVP